MKKIIILILLALSFSVWSTFAWSYPVKEISKIECKFTPWDKHTDDCKMPLPIIKNAEYDKYKKNTTYRLVYSVLWASTYDNGWDIWNWSHLWVDFPSAKWTPVYAMWDWTIVTAWTLNWRWGTVVIKHSFQWKYIYSVYAHLDKVVIEKWKNVKEWDKIWLIWNTWNSWWNHLHFQIDINQKWSHPYYYSSCKWNTDDIVNKWTCRDLVIANTIDPINFLETNWASLNLKDPVAVEKNNQKYTEEKRISPNEIESRKKLMQWELDMFLKRYEIKTTSNIYWNNVYNWKEWSIRLDVGYSNSSRKYDWATPQDIQVVFDKKMVDVVPTNIKYITDWTRDIVIKGKKLWNTEVSIKIGEKLISKYKIRVIDDKTVIEPKTAVNTVMWKLYIWSQSFSVLNFQDKDQMNIIWVPYKGLYTLQVSNNAKICPVYTTLEDLANITTTPCNPDQFTNKIDFDYKRSSKWVTIFVVKPSGEWEIKFEILKSWKKFATVNGINASLPTDLDKKDSYYQSIVDLLKNWYITNVRDAYFAPNFSITQLDAVNWIKATFWVNMPIQADKYKLITRYEFFDLINKITGIISTNNSTVFWDIKDDQKPLANLVLDYNFRFSDQFGDKYFQPEKTITRKEAAFILSKLKK